MIKKVIIVRVTPVFKKYYDSLRDTNPIKKKIDEATKFMENDNNIGVYVKKKPWPKIYVKNLQFNF